MFGRARLIGVAIALVAAACSSSDGVSDTSRRPNAADESVPDDEAGPSTADAVADGDGSSGREDDGADAPAATSDPGPVGPFEPGPIDWEEFDDAVDVATFEVPVDYDDPAGPRFELFLARFNAIDADNRIGSLLVNPGGPGFGGSDFAFFAAQFFDRPLLERFDIIGWDPRGTGESDPPIDCIDDYDPYFTAIDSTPDSEEERALIIETAQDLARQCVARNRGIIEHVGTNNSARDMDAIRRALGEETISYFGFSYGSELGGVWATMYPDTVRAAVFDGASDPEADAIESSVQQHAGFQAAVDRFLARCSADRDCAFHNDGDAEGAFDALMAELDENPVISATGRPRVNRDVALSAVFEGMYTERYWPALEESLAAAAEGDGSGLLALHDQYYRRASDGTWPNLLEALQAISCADQIERLTLEEVEAKNALLSEVAPRLVPEGTTGGYFCSFFPDAIDPRVEITGAGAGPIVVIGTTGDPSTPFESTVRMSDVLEDGRLVVVDANRHTGYNVNRCVIDVVNEYLIDLVAPDDGTECG